MNVKGVVIQTYNRVLKLILNYDDALKSAQSVRAAPGESATVEPVLAYAIENPKDTTEKTATSANCFSWS